MHSKRVTLSKLSFITQKQLMLLLKNPIIPSTQIELMHISPLINMKSVSKTATRQLKSILLSSSHTIERQRLLSFWRDIPKPQKLVKLDLSLIRTTKISLPLRPELRSLSKMRIKENNNQRLPSLSSQVSLDQVRPHF